MPTMRQPEPPEDRDEEGTTPTIFEGETFGDLLRDLDESDLDDIRNVVAGLGPISRSASPTPLTLGSLGPYSNLVEIGRGGMGVVYRAFEPGTGKPVAVKVPTPGLMSLPSARNRFILEAAAMKRLDHPSIVPHLGSGEDESFCYIVTAYCDGPNLETWLNAREAPVPPHDAARIVRELADALEHAHDRGILHRDVKPSNVLLPGARLDTAADALTPRLTDFGLAKLIGEGLEDQPAQTEAGTTAGLLLGSPPYMAPEQAAGRKSAIDRRTDVYGLGALLYELLTRQPPFRGESTAETVRMVIEDDPIPVRVLRPGVPRALETITLRCLEKSSDRRYGSAAALRDDLENFLEGRAIEARSISPIERLRRWSRRHPRLATSGLTVLGGLLLLIGATAVWNFSLQRLNRELRLEIDRGNRISYALRLENIREAFDAGHLSRAQHLLQEQIPEEGETDYREFAWRYLAGLTRREARILPGRTFGFWSAALSADDRWLAGGGQSEENTLSVYDLARDRLVWFQRAEPGESATSIAFSPDGARVAFALVRAGADPSRPEARIEVRDVATGDLLATIARREDRHIRSLHFLDDGRRLSAIYADAPMGRPKSSEAVVWACRGGFIDGPESITPIAWLATAPDGASLAAITPDGGIALFDVEKRAWRPNFPEVATADVSYVKFSLDGGRLIVCPGDGGSSVIFDVPSRRRIQVLPRLDSQVEEAAFQPGGEALILREASQEVRLFDPSRDLDVVVHPATSEPGVGTKHLLPTPDGQGFLVHRSVYMGADHIELRSAVDGRLSAESPGRLKAFDGCWLVKRSAPSELIYGLGRHVWRWDWSRTMKSDPVGVATAHRDEAWAVAYSRDGSLRATSGNEERDPESIKLWNARTGRLLWGANGGAATVVDLAFSPDATRLVTASLAVKGPVRLWDVASGRELAVLDLPGGETARAVEFDPSGAVIYIGGDRGGLFAWDAQLSKRRWAIRPPPERMMQKTPERIHDLKASPDGIRLASANDAGRVRIHDAKTGRVLAEYDAPAPTFAVAYSPDGGQLAAADREGSIYLLDARTAALSRLILSDDHELRGLAYSPDGRTLAAGGLGRRVRLWEPRVGEELLTLEGHTAQINALTFSPDGATLASVDHSGAIRFWRTSPNAPR